MKQIVLLFLILGGGTVIMTPVALAATTSQLTQTINPIQCTYTTIQDVSSTTTPTQCTSQDVPKLSYLTTSSLQPYLMGSFRSAFTLRLRVSIGNNWLTLGMSQALTASGNNWVLDLSKSGLTLEPDTTYTVVVESMMTDGYVFTNIYPDVLTTPRSMSMAPLSQGTSLFSLPPNHTLLPAMSFSPVISLLPLSHAGQPAPTPGIAPTIHNNPQESTAKPPLSISPFGVVAIGTLVGGIVYALARSGIILWRRYRL